MRTSPCVGCLLGITIQLLGLVGLQQSLSAAFIPVSADTFLTEHPGHGGTSAVMGGNLTLTAIGSSGFRAFPLIRFDLSSLAGQTISGTPQVELFLTGGHTGSEGIPRTVNLHEVLIPWGEQTVSWDTFGSLPGVDFGTDVGAPVSTKTVDWAGGASGFIAWDVPAAVVQNWIDQPSQNFGLLLHNQTTQVQVDLGFAALETELFPEARLVFAVVPEPSHAAVLLGAAVFFTGLRRLGKGGAGRRPGAPN